MIPLADAMLLALPMAKEISQTLDKILSVRGISEDLSMLDPVTMLW
jgi:hypothetical protein